jgi:hypothetical protein
MPQIVNQAPAFSDLDKPVGRNGDCRILWPARQRLDANHLPGASVEHRLVHDQQPILGKDRPEFALDDQVLITLVVELRRIDAGAVFSVMFGLVHSHIGASHQLGLINRLVLSGRDADARADRSQPTFKIKRRFDEFDQVCCKFLTARGDIVARKQHDELVAAQTADHRIARENEQSPRNRKDQAISRGMVIGVVDFLEAVQIDECKQDRQFRATHQPPKFARKRRAVRQASQRIVQRRIASLHFASRKLAKQHPASDAKRRHNNAQKTEGKRGALGDFALGDVAWPTIDPGCVGDRVAKKVTHRHPAFALFDLVERQILHNILIREYLHKAVRQHAQHHQVAWTLGRRQQAFGCRDNGRHRDNGETIRGFHDAHFGIVVFEIFGEELHQPMQFWAKILDNIRLERFSAFVSAQGGVSLPVDHENDVVARAVFRARRKALRQPAIIKRPIGGSCRSVPVGIVRNKPAKILLGGAQRRFNRLERPFAVFNICAN